MAYLVYYAFHGAQIILDEGMEAHKQKQKSSPVALARFPLSEAEAKLTVSELMLIYPYHQEGDQNVPI